MNTEKHHLQEWLCGEKFSHTITVEPTPYFPFKYSELQQRIRIISFKLNRKYLGNGFNKFKHYRDRFFFVVIKEMQKNLHYNILVHSPYKFNTRPKWWFKKMFENDFIFEWVMLQSINPYTMKKRRIDVEKPNIFIEPIFNKNGSIIYQTKKLKDFDLVDDDQNYFIT